MLWPNEFVDRPDEHAGPQVGGEIAACAGSLAAPVYEALATAWSVPQHQKFQQIRVQITALQDAALKQEKSVKEAVADMIGQTNTLIAGT